MSNSPNNSNQNINVAYVTSWKERNPQFSLLQTDGHYLMYQNQKIDIRDIYMQDILLNPILFQNIYQLKAQELFDVIRLHVDAMKMKEKDLANKTRRLQEYGS